MDRRSATIAFFIGLAMFAAGYFVRDLFESSTRPAGPRTVDLGVPAVGAVDAPAAVDPRRVRIRVAIDGQLALESGEPTPRALGRVSGVEDGEKRATLDALAAELGRVAALPVNREADGASALTLEIALDGGVPWVVLQWAMQVAAAPAVRIRRVCFAPTDGSPACEVTLPTDVGANTPLYRLPPSMTATVSLARAKDGTVASPRIRIGARDHGLAGVAGTAEPAKDAEGAASLDEPFAAIDAQLVEVHAGSPQLVGEVVVPDGSTIASRLVVRLVRAYQHAGFASIRFGGAAFPKGASPTSR